MTFKDLWEKFKNFFKKRDKQENVSISDANLKIAALKAEKETEVINAKKNCEAKINEATIKAEEQKAEVDHHLATETKKIKDEYEDSITKIEGKFN